ncbi:MAG: thioredoxin [Clostridia bacterium]|nr:thioredoxin [Clostridiales bacterium]MBQ7112939.1 thioredoxin [Clostridia bacterium]
MRKETGFRLLRTALLTAAAALTVFGLMNGEFQKVLQKAAAICLECIGIG